MICNDTFKYIYNLVLLYIVIVTYINLDFSFELNKE